MKYLTSTFFVSNYSIFLHCEKMKIQTYSWSFHFAVI